MSDTLPGAVAIADDAALAPEALLDWALERSGFWTTAETLAPAGGGGRAVVLLDLSHFETGAPVTVRRALVEHLIDALAARGWADVAVASSADSSSTWASNREVAVLADLLGYAYVTAAGTPYDVRDLAEDLADAEMPPGTPFAGATLSRAWLDADLRVVFARCRTDQRETFALCCDTLLAAWPLADKDDHYRLRVPASEAVAWLVRRAPPHFGLVDACGAAHGSGGRQSPRAIDTHAVIAGADVLAVDCLVAGKMGADPADSPLVAGLLAALGRPPLGQIAGSATPFPGFCLPDRLLVESTGARDRSPTWARLVTPWLQRLDPALFPLLNPLDARLNAQIAPRLDDLDARPATRLWLVGANHLLAGLEDALRAWRIQLDKDSVARRVAGVSPETLAAEPDDYATMERELDDLAAWLEARCGPRAPGQASLRWRMLERSVVFDYQRDFPLPFDEMTAHVDVARTIQYMNDYLGGTVLPIELDERGRPVRQVERNLYLPQPNYVALWGGPEIDVSKIESVRYAPTMHRMYWKTLKSENGSARSDDGIVTFEAFGEVTRVTIFGRQCFTLHPLLEAARLERFPELHARLVEHAYETFFFRTFAQFEALVEGREIAVGRAWYTPARPRDAAPRPIDALAKAARRLSERAAPLLEGLGRAGGAAGVAEPAPVVDADGFRHFQAAPAPAARRPDTFLARLTELSQEYTEAVWRDVAATGPWRAWWSALTGRGRSAS